MIYLIDGYNLLFRLLHKGEAVQTAREAMIDQLGKKVNFIDLPTTLVFDSAYQPGWASSHIDKSLEVIYTNQGETADEWLIRFAKKLPSQNEVTIVTSDKRLIVHLRVKGVKILSCEDFITFLNKRVRTALKPQKEIKPLQVKQPLEKKVAKGSTEYYEKLFQEKLQKETGQKEVVNKTSKTLKQKAVRPLEKTTKLSGETEIERWKRLFGA